MKFFIDAEFNNFRGELISLAVVPQDIDLPEFYGVVEYSHFEYLDPWVKENVIPILNQEPEPYQLVQTKFWCYLSNLMFLSKPIDVYADWPEDITHFCNMLCKANGRRASFNASFHLIKSGDFTPKNPHNALSDARALRDWYVDAYKTEGEF